MTINYAINTDLLVPCHCVENIMVDRFQKAAIGKQTVVNATKTPTASSLVPRPL